jgi:hypothetical protein
MRKWSKEHSLRGCPSFKEERLHPKHILGAVIPCDRVGELAKRSTK